MNISKLVVYKLKEIFENEAIVINEYLQVSASLKSYFSPSPRVFQCLKISLNTCVNHVFTE